PDRDSCSRERSCAARARSARAACHSPRRLRTGRGCVRRTVQEASILFFSRLKTFSDSYYDCTQGDETRKRPAGARTPSPRLSCSDDRAMAPIDEARTTDSFQNGFVIAPRGRAGRAPAGRSEPVGVLAKKRQRAPRRERRQRASGRENEAFAPGLRNRIVDLMRELRQRQVGKRAFVDAAHQAGIEAPA